MFGYAGYAQSPYATLGTSAYSVAIIEAFTAADVPIGGYVVTLIEALNLADATTGGFAIPVSITEGQTLADLSDASRLFAASVLETITTETDSESVVATFIVAISETMSVADAETVSLVYYGLISESITLQESESGGATF